MMKLKLFSLFSVICLHERNRVVGMIDFKIDGTCCFMFGGAIVKTCFVLALQYSCMIF